MQFITEHKQTEICGEYDVIVAGGGVAGVAAALSAARNGSRVLLLEKTTVLGGLATSGLVILYFPIDDGMGHKVIGGLCEELLHASIQYGYDSLPDAWRDGPMEADTKERYETVFNAPAFVLALDEKIKEAGIDLLLDTVVCDVHMDGDVCKAVIVENKSGRQAYLCKAVVDATGDADVFFHAGAPLIDGTNTLAYWAYCQSDTSENIFRPGGTPPKYVKVMALGLAGGGDLPEEYKGKYHGCSVQETTRFLLDGRELALKRLKRDPSLIYTSFPSQAQFRTTRRIDGLHNSSRNDAGIRYEDSIGCTGTRGDQGLVYEVPFRELCSSAVKNVFAAGRILVDVFRGIPTCAMTGQAAGTAAMLMAAKGEVDIQELQDILLKDETILHMSDEQVEHSRAWVNAHADKGPQAG